MLSQKVFHLEHRSLRDHQRVQHVAKPIRRIDNLPLISYLNLGGRCRNCLSAIPVRYFLTELIGATIFGSLFLYELVTGAANVPELQETTSIPGSFGSSSTQNGPL